jgi:hypothetical protein
VGKMSVGIRVMYSGTDVTCFKSISNRANIMIPPPPVHFRVCSQQASQCASQKQAARTRIPHGELATAWRTPYNATAHRRATRPTTHLADRDTASHSHLMMMNHPTHHRPPIPSSRISKPHHTPFAVTTAVNWQHAREAGGLGGRDGSVDAQKRDVTRASRLRR